MPKRSEVAPAARVGVIRPASVEFLFRGGGRRTRGGLRVLCGAFRGTRTFSKQLDGFLSLTSYHPTPATQLKRRVRDTFNLT